MARPGVKGRNRHASYGTRRDDSSNTAHSESLHNTRSRPICYFFRDNGRCKYGSACKFSHDLTSNQQDYGQTRRLRVDETPEQKNARTKYSRWRSALRDQPGRHDHPKIQRVWDDALDILNGNDRDTKQLVPQDLDDEDNFQGRQYMRILLSMRPQPEEYNVFVSMCRSFLLVMTHGALVDCLATDTYVGSLYNYMSGHNGTRAIPFFQTLCEIIVSLRTEEPNSSAKDLDTTLVALTSALCELLKREMRPRRNPDLPELANSLDTAAHLIADAGSSYESHIVLQRVNGLKAIIARAEAMIAGITEDLADLTLDSGPTPTSAYPQKMIMPQDRHDNDKADITEVTIFPTHDEIMSDAPEFLPSTLPGAWHYLTNNIARHIDTHFRLFRHDTFGALKTDLANIMEIIAKSPHQLANPKLSPGDTRAYVYIDAFVELLAFGSRGSGSGLQAHISFLQPLHIRRKSPRNQTQWWEESRRLSDGVLMSFIWIEKGKVQHTFFTVAPREKHDSTGTPRSDDTLRKVVIVELMTPSQSNISMLVDLSHYRARGILLEFPNILPSTFLPVLESLQKMQRLGRLPFSQWIIPDRGTGAYLDIPAPLYAREPGFFFSLQSIILQKHRAGHTLNVYPASSCDDEKLLKEMEATIGLDHGQCRAMIAALTREFAFIQGPPGTGKTHLGIKLMKVLLDAKKKADLGPIVVICYTNHALDQFLEHLVQNGLEKVIRIGGRSRSQLLGSYNLRVITQNQMRTRSESRQISEAYSKLDGCKKDITSTLSSLHPTLRHADWSYFHEHLRDNYDRVYAQFDPDDDEGYTWVGRHPFDIWIGNLSSSFSEMSALDMATAKELTIIKQRAAINVLSLSAWEAYSLLHHWMEEIRQFKKAELFETLSDAITAREHLRDVQEEIGRCALQDADVIGLTTTGLAKNIATLQRIRSKVLICEESGEVIEAHMLSAMLPTVEHCIQIGDHEQLRPTINNHDLSLESPRGRQFQLDRSQFERLCIGEPGLPRMPTVQLNVQRRMRPDISTLIRETLYPKLADHPTTIGREDVVGMRQNVFWLDHSYAEDQEQVEVHHAKSKSNAWEVEMVRSLVRHLIRQGVYKSTEIAVLTPYTGQLQRLRAAMSADFEIVVSDRDEQLLARDGFDPNGDIEDDESSPEQTNRKRPLRMKKMTDLLRVATVDNFQGEEAKVIIVSLVRSNQDRKVGFLKTTNRINVLLSRARNGMYLIGNADTYSNVPMWQKVIAMLKAEDRVGMSLDLCCPRHTDKVISVKQPDDFSKYSPEGGCEESCDKRRECGHMCQAKCHSDSMHDVWNCELPCERQHEQCGHPCQKATCGEDCGKCEILCNNLPLRCGHVVNQLPCHKTQHLEKISCYTLVEKESPGCKHQIQIKCSEDVTSPRFRCPAACGTTLACGHPCPGSCGGCNKKDSDGKVTVEHAECTKVCGRPFGTCNHNCPRLCHDGSECGLCESPCQVRCKHSECPLKCQDACAPCTMNCTWSCEHQGECAMPCSAPCNRLPCDERCTILLHCGHQCPSLCGETCPHKAYCQQCGTKARDEVVDMILFQKYSEVDLDQSPIVVLGCGHFFTAETLDGHVGLTDVYEVDETTKKISGLKDLSGPLSVKIPSCPYCKTPIRQHVTQRYNRLINRGVIDEMSKRFIITGQSRLKDLESRLQHVEEELEKSYAKTVRLLKDTSNSTVRVRYGMALEHTLEIRYRAPYKFVQAIIEFQNSVTAQHEPARKLHNAIMYRQQQASRTPHVLIETTLPTVVDRRIAFGGQMMKIKAAGLILEDKFRIFASVRAGLADAVPSIRFPKGSPIEETKPFLKCCMEFINDCRQHNLPKLAVEATLYYARIARHYQLSGAVAPKGDKHGDNAAQYRKTAETLLKRAQELCSRQFQDADILLQAVEEAIKSLREKWYEEVTPEELAAIKKAMVGGSRGIATHSGHWYNCVNGHPFAIGECGMPMERARCPECGEPVGGQNHQAVAGVTRAREMED